jgi:hypothetical protein
MQDILLCLIALAAIVPHADGAEKGNTLDTPGETKRVRWATLPPVSQNTYPIQRMQNNLTIDADWNKTAWKDVPPITLEYYMGDEPEHQPKAQAKAAYDDHFIYIIWKVEDAFVLARRTKNQQDIWRDSCVEFFFTPSSDPKEQGYFNLETNCCGAKLFGSHFSEGEDYKFTADDFAAVVTANSLKGPIDSEITEPTVWTLEYKIPFSVLEKSAKVEHPAPGVKWRCNFYKCADDASRPHWLTWSPVTHAKPSFHLPEYFGILAFE